MINFINNKPLMIIKSYSNLLRNYNYFQYSNTINNNPFNIKHKNFLINNDFINCAKKQNNLNFNKTQKKSFFKKTLILNNTNNKNQNFYEVLGIDRKSSNEQIKQAYLKLAKKYHPDVNKEKDSDENFKNITIAYEALSNQKNRDLYNAANGYENNEKWNNWKDEEEFARQDRARTKQDKYAGGFYRNNYESNFWKGEREDFEEKFYKEYENIFGSGWKESKPQKGEDIMLEISISLFDSYNGATKGIKFTRKEKCHSCKGMRASKGSRPSKCFACNATGEIKSKLKINQLKPAVSAQKNAAIAKD